VNKVMALSKSETSELRSELMRERARIERSMIPGDPPAEHHDIVRALARLEAGEYGSCVRCTNQIPFDRLIVMPATEHCVGCGR